MGRIAQGLAVFWAWGETFLAEPCPITALAELVCIFATCLMSASFVWCPRLTSSGNPGAGQRRGDIKLGGMGMGVAVITGSAGLIGAEAARFFAGKGLDIVGIDNDMRRQFFGEEASTIESRRRLEAELKGYRHYDIDIRDQGPVVDLFRRYGADV